MTTVKDYADKLGCFPIRPACYEDVLSLAPRLRQADLNEIYASLGVGGEAALLKSYSISEEAWTATWDDTPACMFGVAPIEVPTLKAGVIWMLGSYELNKRPVAFLRTSKLMVESLQSRYDILFNFVDERYTQAVNWLRRLGFTFIGRREGFGYQGLPFLEFIRIKRD